MKLTFSDASLNLYKRLWLWHGSNLFLSFTGPSRDMQRSIPNRHPPMSPTNIHPYHASLPTSVSSHQSRGKFIFSFLDASSQCLCLCLCLSGCVSPSIHP